MSASGYPRPAVIALASFVFIAFGVELYAMSVLLTDEAAGGVFSIGTLSLGFGGAGVVAGLAAPRVGRWADHHSVRGIMALGAVLACAAMIAFATVPEAWMVVLAFWLLLGPAQAMSLYEPAFVAVSLWVGKDHRNHAIALLSVIGGIAGPVFLPITGWGVATYGWRPTAVGLGLTVLLVGLVVTAFFYPAVKPKDGRSAPVPRVPWRRFRMDARLLLMSGSVVLMFASLNSMLFHRVAVFEELGYAVGFVAVLAGVSGLLTFPGRYFAPRLAHRFKATSVLGLSIVGVVAAMVLAIVGTPTVVMVAHFVAFGIFFGFTLPLRAVIMNEWYAGDDFGSVMGKQWGVAAVVGGITPWLVGLIHDALDSYTVPLIALTVLVAVSGVLNEAAARSHLRVRAAGVVRSPNPSSTP
ncbi:MAG: MFS transporter, partial [Acidimicrobiia bacterium]|nr:MFS transporter [Acidimicrobiia bacterium]